MSETAETLDLKHHPSVKSLAEHQARLRESDVAFARRYLRLSGSTWGLIKAGKYAGMVQDLTPTLQACEAALAILNDQLERARTGGDSALIIDFAHIRAALAAVKGCYGEPANRLCVYLAPTGGGKTTLARKLRDEYLAAATVVEATETWRTSYFNAGVAITRAAGSTKVLSTPAKVEAELLDLFGNEGRVLVIDEGHYCGPAALNLLKFILNRTGTRVLLMAIPELWNRMEKGAYKEVEQLRRRTAAKFVLASIKLEEARQFLRARLPGYAEMNGEEPAVTKLACDAANRFGLFDTLDRVCTEFAREAGGRAPTLDLIREALKRVEALRS